MEYIPKEKSQKFYVHENDLPEKTILLNSELVPKRTGIDILMNILPERPYYISLEDIYKLFPKSSLRYWITKGKKWGWIESIRLINSYFRKTDFYVELEKKNKIINNV